MKILYITNIPAPYKVNFLNELTKYCEVTVLFERANASDRNEGWTHNQDKFLFGYKILDGRKYEFYFRKNSNIAF